MPKSFRPVHRWVLWAAASLLCIGAQLGVLGSGFWHHHDAGTESHSCGICIAAAVNTSDGLPPDEQVNEPAKWVTVIRLQPDRDDSSLTLRDHRARGPPAD